MKRQQYIHTLLKKITIAPNDEALADILSSLSPPRIEKPVRIAFVNAHGLNLCWKDTEFLHHILESDYVFRDGSGMKILFKMLDRDPGLNLNGTDLIPRIIERYSGHEVALFGTKEPYLDRAADIIRKKGVTPVSMIDGFQNDDAYLQAARNNPAPLIILGMGMPKQERIAALLADNIDYPCLIICGGAILDFMSGKVTRAPVIFRRLGMEWLYRLGLEPKRLFRRYIIGNFAFLFRSCALAMSSEKSFLQK